MNKERERRNTPGIFVFVGENRSKLAQDKGWSWQECQRTGIPRLAAKPLWEALIAININPDKQIFFNLWDDEWKPIRSVPKELKELTERGLEVVAMGQKVHKQLEKLGIPHREMIHPAARGKIRKTSLFRAHVKKVLA